MFVSQMMIQGMWNNKSSLLQLPHLSLEELRLIIARKVHRIIFGRCQSFYHIVYSVTSIKMRENQYDATCKSNATISDKNS